MLVVYCLNFKRYKSAVIALSSREKDLEGSVQRYRELAKAFETENRSPALNATLSADVLQGAPQRNGTSVKSGGNASISR